MTAEGVVVFRLVARGLSREQKLIPARQTAIILSAALLIEGVVDRDVSVTEQGAVADNAAAVEPREAQRPTSLAARTPIATILGNEDIRRGCDERTLASFLAPPGAPFSSLRGKENGMRATPGPKNKEQGAAERWLNGKLRFRRRAENASCAARRSPTARRSFRSSDFPTGYSRSTA